MSDHDQEGEASGGNATPIDTNRRETPSRDVGLVMRRKEKRSESYTYAKAEDDEGDEYDSDVLEIDLATIDRGLLKPSHTRMTTLKQTNYYAWAQFHKHFLEGRGLFGFVDGSILKPADGVKKRNWIIYDRWIAQHLRGCVEETQQSYIDSLKKSKSIWDKLKQVHGVSGKERLAFILQRFFTYVKSADETVDQMAAALKQISNEAYSVRPDARPSEYHRALVIMCACRDDDYKLAKDALSRSDELTPGLAVERLRAVEQDLKRESVNVAKGGQRKASQRGRSQVTDKSNVECFGCGEMGHYKNECPNPQRTDEDQPESARPKSQRKTSDRPKNRPPGRREKAAVANDESEDSPAESEPKERVWLALHKHRVSNRWLVDSGATRHMTPDRGVFTKFTHCGGEVEFGDRSSKAIEGRGTIEIKVGGHKQSMTDVLYVPEMSVNLLSIRALDRRGFTVFFGAQRVEIADSLTGEIVARGRAVDGLYELTNSSSDRAFVSSAAELRSSGSQSSGLESNDPQSNVGLSGNSEPQSRDQGSGLAAPNLFELMHQRLGHPGSHRLKDLHLHADGVKAFEVPKNFQCEICDQAKMVRTISREPQSKTTVPGARLHSDYWGPYPTKSIIGGCIYYVFLIDEATGESRLRPIASKAEVRPFLIHEVRSMIVEGHRLVVVVRLDNAKEYEAAKESLRELGVELEFTSTYTAYQNGISERFNRIITTIARAMLIWSGLPLSFWAEAVIYAHHVYRKLPHGARGSQSPDEMWSGRKPDLSKERVFGCMCRVYLAKEQRVSKLHPVSYLGIYTGYHSSTQYRVYRPDKNRFDWPTTVKFYEDRPGVKLLRPEQLSKYDFLRAEVAPMDTPSTGPTNDAADELNGLISSDDDDQEAPGPPGGQAEPSQENTKFSFGECFSRGRNLPTPGSVPGRTGGRPTI